MGGVGGQREGHGHGGEEHQLGIHPLYIQTCLNWWAIHASTNEKKALLLFPPLSSLVRKVELSLSLCACGCVAERALGVSSIVPHALSLSPCLLGTF